MRLELKPIRRFAAFMGLLAAVGMIFGAFSNGIHCNSQECQLSDSDDGPIAAQIFAITDVSDGGWTAETTDDEQPLVPGAWTSTFVFQRTSARLMPVFSSTGFVPDKLLLVTAPRRGPPPFSLL
jgi:hypothetical protein